MSATISVLKSSTYIITGGKEIGYCAVPDPKRRQENNGEFINHIIVSSLLRIKLNLNEGYAD